MLQLNIKLLLLYETCIALYGLIKSYDLVLYLIFIILFYFSPRFD